MSLKDEVISRLSGPQPASRVVPSTNGYITQLDTDKQYKNISLDSAIFDGTRRKLDVIYWQDKKSKQWQEITLTKKD